MTRFTIEQTATGIILWEGEAFNADCAYIACVQDAGYESIEAAREVAGDDSSVIIYETARPHVSMSAADIE